MQLLNVEPALTERSAPIGSIRQGEAGEHSFADVLTGLTKENTAPYGYLADEAGTICRNGIAMQCDEKNNALCLGDMSRPDKVLNIPLSGGGVFRVNRDNFGDISKVIGMFSPEDARRIMEAVSLDRKLRQKQQEAEETEDILLHEKEE